MPMWDYTYLFYYFSHMHVDYSQVTDRAKDSITLMIPVPKPSYSQARETLVKVIPSKVICLLGCGGRDCRYESPVCWRPNQQAVKGLFSSWVTDDIVAMARPSTSLIKAYDIIDQFKKLNIKSIINMQIPGEHAYCASELDPDSGFTYSPQIFMENQIFFYNFGMADFDVTSLDGILNAVKVLAFSVREGKVAVHCHAGLGRTGVLIACYLIYTLRISASEAVHYVRIKRPCSIQTRAQINMVFDFPRHLGYQLAQYPILTMCHCVQFSMTQYLQRQAMLLHGEEARRFTHTPKILHFVCTLLTALAHDTPSPQEVRQEFENKAAILVLEQTVRSVLVLQRYLPVQMDGSDSFGSVSLWDEPFGFLERKRNVLLYKRSFSESDLSKISQNKLCVCRKPSVVAQAMAQKEAMGGQILQRATLLQKELNSSAYGWATLATETDPKVLSALIWIWLENLKDPVLSAHDISKLTHTPGPNPLQILHKSQRCTLGCLLSCVAQVTSSCPLFESPILHKLIKALTRCLTEDTESYRTLLKMLKSKIKVLRSLSLFNVEIGTSAIGKRTVNK